MRDLDDRFCDHFRVIADAQNPTQLPSLRAEFAQQELIVFAPLAGDRGSGVHQKLKLVVSNVRRRKWDASTASTAPDYASSFIDSIKPIVEIQLERTGCVSVGVMATDRRLTTVDRQDIAH